MGDQLKTDDLLCVIGIETGRGNPHPRKWFTDETRAINYGKELVGANRLRRAYIVRVVKIVEKSLPPIDVRDPRGSLDAFDDVREQE